MYAKVLALIVFATIVALLLLAMRQQRVEAMHQIVNLHRQIEQDRHALWRWQSRIADSTNPVSLRQAIDRTSLDLEPAGTPGLSEELPGVLVRVSHDQP